MSQGITSLPRTELVQMGQRIRAPYLLQQAGVTIAQARAVGDAMLKLMRAGLLDDAEKVRQAVAKAYEDKTVMAEEAKLSTGSQQMAMRAGKQWCRGATARATAASLAGVTLPARPINAQGPCRLLRSSPHLLTRPAHQRAQAMLRIDLSGP